MRNKTLAAALLILAASAHIAAQAPQQAAAPNAPAPVAAPKAPAAAKQPAPVGKRYEALLEDAVSGKWQVDYRELRLAFFESPHYDPLTGMLNYRSLWSLVMQGNWPEAAKQAEAALEKNYVDVNAHIVAHIAYREQGNADKARLHRQWADGLLASIKAGGDGKSAATAWEVISTSEEYAVIRSLNLRAVGQSLVREGGHSYDVLKVLDPQSKTESALYFNIDKPMSVYGRK
jgi:hypothetical protein